MLKEAIQRVVEANPAYAEVTSVIEKEILHHDIMDVLVREGAMQTLTFIGGTSLRLCFNSSRLSEDLDFNGGHDFKPSNFDGLEQEIQKYIENKYETDVLVSKPIGESQGNTSSWKISIEKESVFFKLVGTGCLLFMQPRFALFPDLSRPVLSVRSNVLLQTNG